MSSTPSLLDLTHNLLPLYLYQLGPMEVSRNFLKWSFMSVVAALVGNRVWIRKLGNKLAPNLYINFLGPSASGKDTAIDKAISLIKGDPRLEIRFNYYNGTASHQKLFQRMTRKAIDADGVPPSQLLLVTPELAYSLGTGESADGFIKFMTALYSGKDYLIERDTVTSGSYILKDHCLNWLSGSTINWFPFASLEGGFIGRIVMVEGDYSDARYFDPQPPHDADEVIAFIRERLYRMAWLEGEFTKTPEARHFEQVWYDTREKPDDPAMMPIHRRGHDLLLKLSMIFSLMESNDLTITPDHMELARGITRGLYRALPKLIAHSHATTNDSKAQLMVEAYIREHGQVSRSKLMTFVASKAGNAMQLDQIMRTLEEAKRVQHYMVGKARWYAWKGKKIVSVKSIPRLPDSWNGQVKPDHLQDVQNQDDDD